MNQQGVSLGTFNHDIRHNKKVNIQKVTVPLVRRDYTICFQEYLKEAWAHQGSNSYGKMDAAVYRQRWYKFFFPGRVECLLPDAALWILFFFCILKNDFKEKSIGTLAGIKHDLKMAWNNPIQDVTD